MDYREFLSRPLSRNFIDQLLLSVYQNPTDFQVIYRLMFDLDPKVAWRAAWACEKISEANPDWFSKEQIREIITFSLTLTHGGLHRLCLSILLNVPSSEIVSVDFINACFDWMLSPKCPIAVQALSMKLLYCICLQEPDFIPELKVCLENVDIEFYSPGFKSTRRNILKKLSFRKLR